MDEPYLARLSYPCVETNEGDCRRAFVSLPAPTVSGLVDSFARPGGNITGFTNGSIGGKWLELLKGVSPGLKRLTIIYNPDTAPFAQAFLRSAEAGATTLAVALRSNPFKATPRSRPL